MKNTPVPPVIASVTSPTMGNSQRLACGDTDKGSERNAYPAYTINGLPSPSRAQIECLDEAVAALGGVTPRSLLDTEIGADSVLDTLVRIEHGVFA